MVDRGYIPLKLKDPATRAVGELAGPRHIVGVWRQPDRPGLFTPAPDRKARVWYARDVAGHRRSGQGAAGSRPSLSRPMRRPIPVAGPKGGRRWSSSATSICNTPSPGSRSRPGLLLVYLAYHRAQGRLGFRT